MDNKLFQQFLHRFNELFSPHDNYFGEEVRQHLRTSMMRAFEKLDVVTREQFDAQSTVLARSREKIDLLEQKLADIELKLDKNIKE